MSGGRPERTRRINAAWLARAVLLCAAAPLFAQAPSANISPPPEKFATSPGGVDMRSGRYVYSGTDLAIGGAEGLSLTRTLAQPVIGHSNPFANFSHDWDILLSEKRIDIVGNHFTHSVGYPDYQIEIAFGGLSQTFRGFSGMAFEQVSRSGYARLSFTGSQSGAAVYTLQTGDGTTAVFRPISSADCSATLRCAYVEQIMRADGTVLGFSYDRPGGGSSPSRLRRITSNRGYALLFDYAGGSTRVEKACVLNLAVAALPGGFGCPATGAQATATYDYVSFNAGAELRLSSATNAAGATSTFSYAGASPNIIMGFVRPGETSPWLVNTLHERTDDDGLISEIVSAQAFADGSSYSYLWNGAPQLPGHVSQLAGGSFTDALGQTSTLAYDFPTKAYSMQAGHGNVEEGGPGEPSSPIVQQTTPGPRWVTDPLGRVTTYDYCDPYWMANAPPNWQHRCIVMPGAVSVTDPGGIRTDFSWDLALRVVTESRQYGSDDPNRLNPITRKASYNCSLANFRFCTSPVSVTDARNNTTDYVYDPAHGGLLSESGPAVNGVRPQTRHIYAQRHAWISNGSGGYVQAATPVWLRMATSLCRTSAATGNPAAPCATAGDEVLTQYDYGPNAGPNTLLLRGQTVTSTDGGQTTTLRSCYTYDAFGRRISETQPNANLASCP
jgi:YD repeat-containing protein